MVKTAEQIKMIRIAGKILANTAKQIRNFIREGVSLKELDGLAKRLIEEAGAEPAFLGYQPHGADKPYPASICASLNEAVVHGVPTGYKLKSGDVLSIDFGVTYHPKFRFAESGARRFDYRLGQGHIADAAFTVGIGKISREAASLIDAARRALLVGIKECRAGKTLGDIGWAINNYAVKHGFKVIKGLSGHGVGLELHEEPAVFNEGQRNTGLKLKPGMVLALEPMLSAGSPHILQQADGSYVTRDKSLSAHFEHTVLITDKAAEVLTR